MDFKWSTVAYCRGLSVTNLIFRSGKESVLSSISFEAAIYGHIILYSKGSLNFERKSLQLPNLMVSPCFNLT